MSSDLPSRHIDTGKSIWHYGYGQQWVTCVQCGQAGVVQNGRFVCRHCTLVLQNDDNADYWFGECELYADGRCDDCDANYTVRENYPKVMGNIYKFRRAKIVRCQTCGRDNTVKTWLSKTHYQGFDSFFGMPLLLKANFKGHIFWAYNGEHLAELKSFIEADLRERTQMAGNGSMISRLPLWIKSAKNREDLLKLIEKLDLIIKTHAMSAH